MNYCVEIEIVVLNFIVFNWVEKDTADGSITGKDATQKGIHLVSNRFISPEREAEYQKYGELHIRPRAMLFCAVAGLAHATYTVIRWFGSSRLAHTDLQTIRTIRVICTFIPLILLPCMHFFPTKWKECTTMFIAMNAITLIIYYFQKRELAVYSNVNDVSLFYQNWNLNYLKIINNIKK